MTTPKLTPPQIAALKAVGDNGADFSLCCQVSVSPWTLKKLSNLRLVDIRETDFVPRKAVRITDAGRSVLAKIKESAR